MLREPQSETLFLAPLRGIFQELAARVDRNFHVRIVKAGTRQSDCSKQWGEANLEDTRQLEVTGE